MEDTTLSEILIIPESDQIDIGSICFYASVINVDGTKEWHLEVGRFGFPELFLKKSNGHNGNGGKPSMDSNPDWLDYASMHFRVSDFVSDESQIRNWLEPVALKLFTESEAGEFIYMALDAVYQTYIQS